MIRFTRIAAAALLFAVVTPALALPVNINYTDVIGYGFNDPTFGAQRRVAFETALGTWTSQLQGAVPLEVIAHFEAMGGDAFSATLAYAGPISVARDFPGSQPSTWYVSALANQLAGADLDPSGADIEVVINSDLDGPTVLGDMGFYYGIDGNSGTNVDFRTTILHEIGHGLGFISLLDSQTGEFFQAPGDASPLPDAYSRMLVKAKKSFVSSKNKSLDNMRAKKRKKAIKSQKLRWNGPAAFAGVGYLANLYSPKKVEPGSSISHWDTAFFPDLLMEPFNTGPKFGIDLAKQALEDMGWKFN